MSNYTVEATDYGMMISYQGFPHPDELQMMNQEIGRVISKLEPGFGCIVDMRANKAFSGEGADQLKHQIDACKKHGMNRSAVILQSAIMTLQARRLATETGITDTLLFIDASTHPNWEEVATDWITKGIRPS